MMFEKLSPERREYWQATLPFIVGFGVFALLLKLTSDGGIQFLGAFLAGWITYKIVGKPDD